MIILLRCGRMSGPIELRMRHLGITTSRHVVHKFCIDAIVVSPFGKVTDR